MKMIDKICIVLLALMLPVAVICLSETGVWRISETYEYSLKESEILNKMHLNVSEEDVAHTFTRYVNGKTDDFQIIEKTGTVEAELFTEEDEQSMSTIRGYAGYLLYAGIVALIIAIAAYVRLRIKTKKTTVKAGFHAAIAVFICLQAANLIIRLIDAAREAVFGWLFDFPDAEGDLLTGIMKGSLPEQFAVFQTITAVVAMLILWYISSRITRPEKIFFRR